MYKTKAENTCCLINRLHSPCPAFCWSILYQSGQKCECHLRALGMLSLMGPVESRECAMPLDVLWAPEFRYSLFCLFWRVKAVSSLRKMMICPLSPAGAGEMASLDVASWTVPHGGWAMQTQILINASSWPGSALGLAEMFCWADVAVETTTMIWEAFWSLMWARAAKQNNVAQSSLWTKMFII